MDPAPVHSSVRRLWTALGWAVTGKLEKHTHLRVKPEVLKLAVVRRRHQLTFSETDLRNNKLPAGAAEPLHHSLPHPATPGGNLGLVGRLVISLWLFGVS